MKCIVLKHRWNLGLSGGRDQLGCGSPIFATSSHLTPKACRYLPAKDVLARRRSHTPRKASCLPTSRAYGHYPIAKVNVYGGSLRALWWYDLRLPPPDEELASGGC